MSLPDDHGVIQLSKMLDSLDGKTIRVGFSRNADKDIEFERAVLKVLNRRHRRQQIAEN